MKRVAAILLLFWAVCLIAGAQEYRRLALPWVISGYRYLPEPWKPDSTLQVTKGMWRGDNDSTRRETLAADAIEYADRLLLSDSIGEPHPADSAPSAFFDPEHPLGAEIPDWLRIAIRDRNAIDDIIYRAMVENPACIDYAEWDLPVPPRLPEEDTSFLGYLRRMHLPLSDASKMNLGIGSLPGQIHWLHTLNFSLQLSQAYISHNWYQGGSDYLAFFGNFLWDVLLNPTYHENLMFQSTLNYKLAINSTLQDKYHKYSVSQELFQYNLKFGFKALRHWYYSLTALFKTQFLHSYPSDSEVRTASFLSPGTLNVGAGMTYNYEKPNKRLLFSASISPISYNLRTCIDRYVDHAQLGMDPNQHLKNEYGSNAEVNFYWAFRENLSYKTRLFLFTDYKNFTGDWENTFNFQWTKLFSTQIYLYFRYDSATDPSVAPKWKKWMLKEILSVGLSYTFSTKKK